MTKTRQVAAIAAGIAAIAAAITAALQGNYLAALAWGVTAIAWAVVLLTIHELSIWRGLAEKWEPATITRDEIAALTDKADAVLMGDVTSAVAAYAFAYDIERVRGNDERSAANYALASMLAFDRDRQATR